jgi:hypothetical protein
MQRTIVLAVLLASCSTMTPEQQGKVAQAMTVACNVDGVVVPVTQPIVAGIGPGGATAVNIDALLVHLAVVQACAALRGTPASVTITASPGAPSVAPAKPVS